MERAVEIVQKDDLKQTFSHWAAYRARLDLAQGDLSAAQRAQEIEPSTSGDLNPGREFEHITLVQIYLAQQRLDDAQHLLARLLPAAQAAGRMGRVLEIVILQALTADAHGNQAEALTTLDRALTLVDPEGYVRIFVDEGAPMAALLRAAHQHGIVPAYVARLLAAFPSAEGRGPSAESLALARSVLSPRSSTLVEPFSDRELDVLRLIVEGHSNQAIADRLVVALSTVKKHVNNIYGKLDVQSRTQALLRARELKLL
jgi:LuxR family transcriptional regulator, maltose regulon positive regulatory protein